MRALPALLTAAVVAVALVFGLVAWELQREANIRRDHLAGLCDLRGAVRDILTSAHAQALAMDTTAAELEATEHFYRQAFLRLDRIEC